MRTQVEQIHKAGERASALTQQLLAFSRKQVMQPKVLDLNAIVGDSELLLKRLIGENIVLESRRAPEAALVMADPVRLGQVLMNLAVNARDAMPHGGTLVIQTSLVEVDDGSMRGQAVMAPGSYVLMEVRDTGKGMTADVQARLFEPFFTTKDVGMGTGLGLSVVLGIVQQSGGYIQVTSELDQGTTFGIYLPRITDTKAAPLERHHEGTARRGSETVLLVEDEGEVRSLSRMSLESAGYTVLEAADAEAALQMAERHRGAIDLLVTDVVMPGMSGSQLAERMRHQRPSLMVLFMSGYTQDAVLRHGIEAGEMAFLQKPFSPVALAEKVRDILDGTAT